MDKPPRRLLPGYEPLDQSPPALLATSTSGSSSGNNNNNNNNAPASASTSKFSAAGLSTSTSSSSTRRQVTSLACNECRRVKCKCDGERPTCGLCERKGLVCDYDVGPRGRTALMALRHQYSILESENNQLRELLRLIATLPPPDASEVLGQLRTNEDPLRVLQMVQAARLLMAESSPAGSGGDGSSTAHLVTIAAATPTQTQQQLPESSTRTPTEPSLTRTHSDENPKAPQQRLSGSAIVQSDLRMILNEPDED